LARTHAAEQQGDGAIGDPHRLQHVFLIQNPGQDQDAKAEEGGHRHVDHIQGDQQDDAAKDPDGEVDLYIGHGEG
jgi:hypothetical protein